MKIKGLSHAYGDNIDTDRIIPGKYTKTLNMQELADHVLEDLDPDFRIRMKQGDIIVGGSNFGCGSSREQAPIAIKLVGVSAVIAHSFARIFFRNAVNIGLPVIEIGDHSISTNDQLEIDLSTGVVANITQNKTYQGTKIPDVMVEILNEGGLVPYLNKFKQYNF